MPILGIDGEKCIKCEECVKDCPALLFAKTDSGQIVYSDPKKFCIRCGHCVAICPTDAILREHMDGVETFPGVETPEKLVGYADFFHALQAKRSIRRFKKDAVPQPILDKIYAAIRYAPAGTNLRTVNYTLLSDPAKIAALSDAACETIMTNPMFGPVYGEVVRQKLDRGIDPIFYRAPHVLIADSPDESGIDVMNATIALTYATLAAQTLGVASCWCALFQMAARASKEVRRIAGVRGKIWCVILLGYPDVKYHRAPSRRPLKVREEK